MAYERALSSVEYDWVSSSYNENSLSGVVFLALSQFFYHQENDRRRAELWPPGQNRSCVTFVSP
jgi:hypothetical protein